MSNEREELAQQQAKLLETLFAAKSPRAAQVVIQELSPEAIDRELDLRMIDVAIQLTRKWGVPINKV